MLALATNILELKALPPLLVIGLIGYGFKYSTNKSPQWLSGLGIFIGAILLMLHLVPGFNNPVVIENALVSANAAPYTKYLNIDKAVLGILLLYFVVPKSKVIDFGTLSKILLVFLLCSTVSITIGLYGGLISFDPKLPYLFLGWALTNLFFTCFVEEAFFRGFVQRQLARIIGSPNWQYISVLLSGVLFGLAHFPGGVIYTFIASIMGMGYAYSYHKNQNIYVPIAVHFMFNLIHFCFFTYPFIAN